MTNLNTAVVLSILLPTMFLFTAGCGSTTSGEFAQICEDLDEAIDSCDAFDEENNSGSRDLRVTKCLEDFDDAEQLDGPDCVNAQIALVECNLAMTCDELLEYVAATIQDSGVGRLQGGDFICLKATAAVVDCCEAELVTVIEECVESFRFFLQKV